MLQKDVEALGLEAAITQCEQKIRAILSKYIGAYVGLGLGGDALEAVIAAVALGIAKKAGLASLGFVGLILLVDSLVDAGITISKISDMSQAANDAVKRYCTDPWTGKR